jgi:hypothetical protein
MTALLDPTFHFAGGEKRVFKVDRLSQTVVGRGGRA